jgi:hypothetical protein
MTWSAALGLSEEQARRAVPAALFQVAFVAAVTVLKSTAAALVVGRASATSLPWLYIVSAFATAAAAGLWPQKQAHTPSNEMALWAMSIWSLVLVTHFGLKPGVLGLYLVGDAFATLNQVRFWARAGELFDLRASRRLFALLGGASMVGAVFGGLVTQYLSHSLGPEPLAAASGALALGSGKLGAWMDRAGPSQSRNQVRSTVPWTVLHGDALILRVGLFVGLSGVLTVAVDYLFRARAGEVLDERQLSALFGAINVWMGLLSAAFQLVLARRLLDRLGLFYFLAMVPSVCAGLGVASLLSDRLGWVVGLKVVEAAGSLSLTPLAVQLLYGPMPDDRRSAARAAIDGLVKKAGLGFGGLLLLFEGGVLGRWLPLFAVGVASTLVLLLTRLQKVYVAELSARLSRAHWDVEIELDAHGRRVLVEGLKSKQLDVVLAALDLLAQVPEELTSDVLRPVLSNSSERVQERAVGLVGRLGRVELLPEVRALVAGERRRPRDEAVRVLARLSPGTLLAEVQPLLNHPDPGTRAAAIEALWNSGPGRSSSEAALSRLGRLESPVAERRELARVLGRIDRANAYDRLQLLLDDPEPSVRGIAYASAAQLGIAEWTGLLLSRLARRSDRNAVRAALTLMGNHALDPVEKALNDRNLPLTLRLELPRVLRDMGTAEAANALLHSNIRDAAVLHQRIGLALSAMRREHPRLPLDVAWVKAALGRRLDAYERFAPMLADLRTRLPVSHLLVRAVADRCDQALEVAFRLLALLAPHEQVMDAHHRLRHGGSAERNYAAELVENLLPDRKLRRRMAADVDRYHRHAPLGDGEKFEARLAELLSDEDRVLRACARHEAMKQGRESSKPTLLPMPREDEMNEQVVETLFLLEGVELFKDSGVDEMAALAAIAHEERAQAGQAIFRRGDPGDRFFVIIAGSVRVERAGQIFFHLGARDSFGEVSLLDGAPRPADVIAETDCHLLAIGRQDFLDLVSDRPELLQGVLAQVAHHLRLILEGPGGSQVSLGRPSSSPGVTVEVKKLTSSSVA